MIKKGIVLAGGSGTRMSPITKAVNKQLLPLYDKPLFFYPLSVLMLAGIKNILIIVNKGQIDQFKKVLPDGNKLGIKIEYIEQNKPIGLPDAFLIGEKFINNDPVALILGDNFFFGQSLTKKLIQCTKLKKGAKIFVHPVKKPSLYGVASINKYNKITKIEEKPKKPKSNFAITGLYFFDQQVVSFSKTLKPSKRNELEIVDILNKYKKKNQLSSETIGRGGAWLDTGSPESLNDTSNFVSAIQNMQGFQIGCLEEVSYNKKWIDSSKLKMAIDFYGNCDYSKYLSKLLK